MRILLAFILLAFTIACNDNGDPGPMGDELPKISIGHVTLFEGQENQQFNFAVQLSESSEQTVTVEYRTEEISAGENTDFIPEQGTLIFLATERNQNITIEIVGDEWKENDEEFKVVLFNPTNATLSSSEGIGTIRDEDTIVMIDPDGYSTPLAYPGLTLIWNDEFDGTTLDAAFWNREQGNHGWGNNEWQNYTDRNDNAFLSDGKLIIEAKEENFGGSDYTSARLTTQNKFSFTHGRVDIRATLPKGQGIWPALWMLGDNFATIGWPACGEIDIMELLGHEPNKSHGTSHAGPQGSPSTPISASYTLSQGDFTDEFHVFSIIWGPGQIDWYVDDNKFHTITTADINVTYPFDRDFFFIFNVAVGGNWPGYPDATTSFPQRMIVDYIRVFQ